jgi:ribonuclease P protein component
MTFARAQFPSAARLHRPSEYAVALKSKRVARGALLVVMSAKAGDTPRLGLIIGKRQARLAATRNAVKRTIREAFRHKQHTLPARDFVFRLHAKIDDISLTALKRQVRQEADAHLSKVAKC